MEQQEINNIVCKLTSLKVEGVAICLLHSYSNSTHEIKLKNAIKKAAPHLFVSASSEIWPQMREYERATATVMNAYLHSIFSRYLIKLEESLLKRDVKVQPYITRSNGGIMTIDSAKERPVETLLSGPASGVIGALDIGKRAGLNDLIILDMGGTSADVSIIENGKAPYSHGEHIGDFPLILPSIAISSIGAGGGSIAWLDGAGVLKVGPKSAGADPGPACYDRGGTEPTLSDAFLLCGFLNPTTFASETKLSVEASKASMYPISKSLNFNIEETANAVIQVGLVNMYTELSAVIERKGIDPREFTLVSLGGAGSIVSCQLAEEVNIGKVLIPLSPGTLSAFGSLNADITEDFISSLNWQLEDNHSEILEQSFEELRNRSSSWLEREATNVEETELQWSAEMRYKGQSHEIEVLLKEEWIYEQNIYNILTSFHQTHKELFNHSDPNAPVEMINLRLKAIGFMPVLLTERLKSSSLSEPQPIESRKVIIKGVMQTAKVFPRSGLAPGHQFDGPAIIEQLDTTTIVPSGWTGDVDTEGNIIITRKVNAQW